MHAVHVKPFHVLFFFCIKIDKKCVIFLIKSQKGERIKGFEGKSKQFFYGVRPDPIGGINKFSFLLIYGRCFHFRFHGIHLFHCTIRIFSILHRFPFLHMFFHFFSAFFALLNGLRINLHARNCLTI